MESWHGSTGFWKPFFRKEGFSKETGFHGLRCGVRGICGHHVVITAQKGKAGKWWRRIYISGQKGYDEIEAVRGVGEKPGVMPVISEEKAKTHKTGYMTLYEIFF
jgi:hypothetical protein